MEMEFLSYAKASGPNEGRMGVNTRWWILDGDSIASYEIVASALIEIKTL